MTERKTQTSNKQVQTTIHCYPHILLSDSQIANVFSDRGCQTVATTTPETLNINFYGFLEFIPYQVIAEGCLKEVDLPRKALLQWNLPTATSVATVSSSNKSVRREELELIAQRSALKNVSLNRTTHYFTMQRSVVNVEVQTTLSVSPHVLDADEVANVFAELSIQTSITCLPNESISNILPQLKANLSHVSGYTETASVVMNQPPATEPSEGQPEGEEEIEREDEPPEDSPDDPPEEPPDDAGEDSPGEETDDQATQVDTLSVTISTAQVESQHVCSCRTKMLNQMTSRLRVQASTLKLTPVAFPPDLPFGDRMMEVLNTIIAVLQTEMSNLMEIYVQDEKDPCACSGKSKELPVKDISLDPRSCKCAKSEAGTTTDARQMAIANDPRSCKCGARAKPQQKSSTITQGSQREIKKTTATRQVINPITMQPELVQEDTVEETIRVVTLSNKTETVIREKTVTKTMGEKLPGSPTAENLMIEPAKAERPPCTCTSKAGVEVIKPAGESAPEETETEDLPEPASDATEAPTEEEEPSEIAPEAVPLPDDEFEEDTEPPAAEDEVVVEAEVPAEEEAAEEVAAADEEPADVATEVPPAPLSEVVGDGAQIRRLSFIPCECHPTGTGAAVPMFMSPGPSARVLPPSESSYDPCSCAESPESTTTDIANASDVDEFTDEAPSLVDDAPSGKKTYKFKILLKKGISDVKSVSATSTIAVRATLSCPDTSKEVKPKVSTASSLPDLREQVIRLRVIYKTGATQPDRQFEELLSPGHPVTIAPNKSPSSRVNQTSSKISAKISFTKKKSASGITESDRLVCAKGPSAKTSYNNASAARTDPCGGPRRQPYPKPSSHLPIEIEEVPFSSMACPVHPKKSPACIPACSPHSAPSSGTKAGVAITISISTGAGAGAEDGGNLQSSSFMYERDAIYEEPYMAELVEAEDATTGVQTDLALGDKLQSESLNSLGAAGCIQVTKECGSRTEMPWQEISLQPPGSYTIQSTMEPTQQVGVMTEEAGGEQEADAEEEAASGADEDASGAGEEASGAGEEPPPEEPPEESGSGEERPKRKEQLLFETEDFRDNEPYMEGLYRAFPDSDEGECGSQTEIPWKDIILPENCRIKKVLKQKCTCKSGQDKLSGMFIPSNTPPRYLEDDDGDSLVTVHLGFGAKLSALIPVPDGGAASQRTLSYVSTVSDMLQKPKRVSKNCTLLVNLAKESVSYQAGTGARQDIPQGSVLHPTSSQPFSVSTAFGGTSSAIINIKSSTERPFTSQRIPVPGGNERVLQVVNPSMYVGSIPTTTKSCTGTNVTSNTMSARNTASMPQIPSQGCVKATVSTKRLGQPDKVVTQTMNLVAGQNRMTLNMRDNPVNANLKMPGPGARAQSPNSQPCPLPCHSTPCPPTTTGAEPKEIFSPAKCECKDKVKLDTFRQDPVIAALEAYESEMRPLRQALTQLQQKIRNLNLPEMKGCLCTTALENPQPPCPCPTTTAQGRGSANTGSVGTSLLARPRQNPPGACPYYQPARFRPPPSPPTPYGRLPPPNIPPRFDAYMATPPNYSPPGGHQQNCRCEGQNSRTNGRKKQNREHRPNRDHARTYPREDLAMEARHHGMYPDYRGRRYSNETAAYQDSFVQESRNNCPRRGGSPDKYKNRHVVSIHSSGNVTSDYGGYDSQGASDGEDSYHQASSNCRNSKRNGRARHSNDRRTPSKYNSKAGKRDQHVPCRDFFDSQLRDGQAVKTSPDEFLSCQSPSARRPGQNGMTHVISKTKIQIKCPRK